MRCGPFGDAKDWPRPCRFIRARFCWMSTFPITPGLGVLDRLERKPETRHIPVHVVSVADYAQEALELGAIGYALKPVKREQLVEAFQRLEAKIFAKAYGACWSSRTMSGSARAFVCLLRQWRRRDHARGRNRSAALAELQRTTFDCMVMDLNLPDLSGYQLLEKMARADGRCLSRL